MNNRKIILWHAGLSAAYENAAVYFMTAYALLLGAGNLTIGLLGAATYVAIMLSEIPGAKLVEYMSRRRLCSIFPAIAKLGWIIVILAPTIHPANPFLLIIPAYLLTRFLEFLADPSYNSLLADLIDEKIRGEFIGQRNKIMNLVGIAISVTLGIFLNYQGTINGFSTVFAIGAVFGLMASTRISRILEPPYNDNHHHKLSEFFMLDSGFKKFILLTALFNFSVMLASPFFSVFLLKDLQVSYSMLALIDAIALITKILMFKPVGKLSDKVGDKPLAIIFLTATALVPLTYLFVTKETFWLVIPANIISGIAWAGTDVLMINLLLGLTTPSARAMQVASYQMINSLAMIIAPILGGIIADKITIIGLFMIATLLRAVSGLLFTTIKEPRAEKEKGVIQVMYTLIHPMQEMRKRVIHSKQSIAKTI